MASKTVPVSEIASGVKEEATSTPTTSKAPVMTESAKLDDKMPTVVNKDKTGSTVQKKQIVNTQTTMASKQIVSPQVASLNNLIKRYLTINNGRLVDDDQRKRAIDTFADIVRFAVANPTDECLGIVYKFFKDNKSVILAPKLALQGITSLPMGIRSKVEVFYTAMCAITSNKKTELDMSVISKILDSAPLVNYISKKIKR